jgi:iron complex outermembrane receptor protein
VRADYAVPQVAGLNVNGSWEYAGKKAFEFSNTTFVPSYSVFNLVPPMPRAWHAGRAARHRQQRDGQVLLARRDAGCGRLPVPGRQPHLPVSAQFDF